MAFTLRLWARTKIESIAGDMFLLLNNITKKVKKKKFLKKISQGKSKTLLIDLKPYLQYPLYLNQIRSFA